MRKSKGERLADHKLAEKVEEMFPASKLDRARKREHPFKSGFERFSTYLTKEQQSVNGAISRLKHQCVTSLVTATYGEKWGEAMQQIRHLRQLYTLEWQMRQRERGG